MHFALIKAFVRRDFKDRLAGSVLGPVLLFVQPLLQILTFIFLFKLVFKVRVRFLGAEEDFLRFFLAGYLPWSFHAESLARGGASVVQHAHLVTKVKFPVEVLPVSKVLSAYLAGILGIPLLLAVLAFAGGVSSKAVCLPLLLPPAILISLSVVFVLSALAVYFRDFLQMIPVFLPLWFYATPILYSREMLPYPLEIICAANPLTPVVESWQKLLLSGEIPVREALLAYGEGILLLVPAYLFFKKLQKGFCDVL